MSNLIALDECLPGLSTELAQAVQTQHLSTRTSHTYRHWIGQYLAYYDLKSPKLLTEKNVSDFLKHVTKSMSLSRARLNQARAALVFLYEKVLNKPLKPASLPA
ncbi:MAG: site-specific integrase [Oleiphilus sp.]